MEIRIGEVQPNLKSFPKIETDSKCRSKEKTSETKKEDWFRVKTAAARKAQKKKKKSGPQASSNPYISRVLAFARASTRDCTAAAPSLILTLSPW